MNLTKSIFIVSLLTIFALHYSGCSYLTYQTLSTDPGTDSTAAVYEPDYNVTLDFDYQDFTSYLFMGNRVENFTAYFNTYFRANEDFEDAFEEYRLSLISYYNRRLDSLGVSPAVSGTVKEKLDKAIERASKIIQFNTNSKFIDDAVLLIGKSYYIETDYYKSERTFNEFLSKFSSSIHANEAILYLGRTKVKLDKIQEGEIIFKNLLKNSSDNEIRSLAARDLGIIAYNGGKLEEAVNYFNESIDYSNDKERKAEGQFILAKILSVYKPELAAKEYNEVLNYTSDYDLAFYARLNYAKGLINNKDFANATEELTSLRKKYRDEAAYTQLVDLETANNLYDQKSYQEAKDKYYEVIVKYPSTTVSSDAYYHLAKYEEENQNDYLNALVNYKKAVEESLTSDYYKESFAKSATLERYFTLIGELGDSSKIDIPTANVDVEKYRRIYNEDKGINQPTEGNKDGTLPPPPDNGTPNTGDDGRQTGDGKGKPGGFKNPYFEKRLDSLKEESGEPPSGLPSDPSGLPSDPSGLPSDPSGLPSDPSGLPSDDPSGLPNNPLDGPIDSLKGTSNTRQENYEKRKKDKEQKDSLNLIGNDSLNSVNNDSLKAVEEAQQLKVKEDKIFNAYYEIAELFIYNLDRRDSSEHYLKLLLAKYPDPDKQAKVLYTLGNFYKNTDRKARADETFNSIISTYPNTIYAYESKKIMGIKTKEFGAIMNSVDSIFSQSMNFFMEKKYPLAILKLQEVEIKYPNDTLVAKSLYSIGWMYENSLDNNDSSIVYYKKLKEKFPNSEYALKVIPMLDYIASLEVPDSTGSGKETAVTDDSTSSGEKEVSKENSEEDAEKKKEENPEVVSPNPEQETNTENKLSQEEIDRLLREGDEGDGGK
ncbi:MAG: tetratricopeptide repeat protein [Bacteroidota bacterium]|nr:tetratricopeptide repeat protein [Bacteroidota bacterium]